LLFFRLLVIITRKHLPRKRSEKKRERSIAMRTPLAVESKNIDRDEAPYPQR
jgi:hypothetical protein